MRLLALIFILLIFIFLLVVVAIWQMKQAGIKIKDFATFINANENLDRLYKFAMRYEQMSTQEQIIYLVEAEKLFQAFDRIPETVWEDEHEKYSKVVDTYKNIRVMRWNEEQEYKNSTKEKTETLKEINDN